MREKSDVIISNIYKDLVIVCRRLALQLQSFETETISKVFVVFGTETLKIIHKCTC